jgi:hypothetical protein
MLFRQVLLLTAALFLASYQNHAQVLGNPIVQWDFANGLPADWQTGITSTNNVAHWEYRGANTVPNNNVGTRGSCGASYQAINSVTRSNGFMIFDSNYWDDPGNQCGQLGTGSDPAPHTAWMITSSINLTAYPNAVLTFQQQFRHLSGTTTKVQISVDQGPWTDIMSNTGTVSPNVQWKTVNIGGIAGGHGDVRFRFIFNGSYYWWLLDDITVYTPSENDISLNWVGYSSNPVGLADVPYSGLPYTKYPVVMIPTFPLSASATNIGGNDQTNTRLHARVFKNNTTLVHEAEGSGVSLAAGETKTYQISPNFTNPAEVGQYKILYDMRQNEVDEVPANDLDSAQYDVTAFTYARDKGAMVNTYTPVAPYTNYLQEIGNMFFVTQSGKRCHSLQVGLAEGTLPGTQIRGIIYSEDLETIVAQTSVYTVNSADINSVGQSKVVTLHFPSTVSLSQNTYYYVAVKQQSLSQPMRIARSGNSPSETSFVRFTEVSATFYSTTTPVVRMNIFNNGVVSGCTDPLAMNYVSNATANDGSCRYAGCTDELATNYNPNANFEDGTCYTAGCMDPLADNYNPLADQEDDSCIYYGCIDEAASNYDSAANTDDGSCIYIGCTNPNAENYNELATIDDGSCIILGCMDDTADNYNPEANEEDGSCIYYGCTDSTAVNYDSTANTNDGSCIFAGCTNEEASNYNPVATIDDGSCIVPGCTDESADNYNPEANEEDGSCIYYGCTDSTAVNYDSTANTNDGSCIYAGCTNEEASNYNPIATIDDGSCIVPGCTDESASNYNEEANEDDGSCVYPGCMDPLAINYNPDASEDDGSCIYVDLVVQVSATEGCAPLHITLQNQTQMPDEAICSLLINDEETNSECAPQYVLNFTEAGEYHVKFVYTWNDMTSDTTITITVHPSPEQPILQYDAANRQVVYTNASTDQIAWYYNDVQVEDVSSDVLNTLYDGFYRNGYYGIIVTNEFNCTAAAEALYVLQPVILLSTNEGCAPYSITIENLTHAVDSIEYTLTLGDGTVITELVTSYTHTYTSEGTHQIELHAQNNLGEGTVLEQVTIHPAVTPVLVHVSNDGLVVCENCTAFETVVWDMDGTIFHDNGPHSDNAINYMVIGTTQFGCVDTAYLDLSTNSVQHLHRASIQLYPNPTRDFVIVDGLGIDNNTVEVWDAMGKRIQSVQTLGRNQVRLDTHTFSSGLYTIRVAGDAEAVGIKLLVQQ